MGLSFYGISKNIQNKRAAQSFLLNIEYRADYIKNFSEVKLDEIKRNESNLKYIDLSNKDNVLKVDVNLIPEVQINRIDNLVNGDFDIAYKFIFYFDNKLYYENVYDSKLTILREEHNYYIVDNNDNVLESFQLGKIFFANINTALGFDYKTSNKTLLNDQVLIKNDGFFITYQLLEEFDLYLFQVAPQSYYQFDLDSSIYLIAFILIVLISITIYISSIYINNRRAYKDNVSLNEFFISKYNNFYTATVDAKGNFLYYNDLFREIFIKNKENNIYQFKLKGRTEANKDNFAISLPDKDYIFTYADYGENFILVGENYSELIKRQRIEIYSDKITSLANYNALVNNLKYLDVNRNYVFLIVCLNDYKQILSRYSEDKVEKIIKRIASEMQDCCNLFNANLYHTNQDRFVILINDAEDVDLIKEKMGKNVENLNKGFYQSLNTIFDIRVGILKGDKELVGNPDNIYKTLVDLQNQTMNSYFNHILIYDSMIQDRIFQYNEMKLSIENGIINDEFVMYLQPTLDLRTNKIDKYEALLRWNNHKYKNISPSIYIKAAEEIDLIYRLGDLVVQKTLDIIKKSNLEYIRVSINISLQQFLAFNFTSKLIRQVKNSGVSPKSIVLEITESIFVESMDIVIKKLNELKSAGFKILLDDFGTGYSSLKYLNELPVHGIKIDKSFVSNILKDKKTEAITTTIIEMALGLKILVVAEGVETEQEFMKMKELGVNYIQGYLVSKPIPHKEALEYHEKTFTL